MVYCALGMSVSVSLSFCVNLCGFMEPDLGCGCDQLDSKDVF